MAKQLNNNGAAPGVAPDKNKEADNKAGATNAGHLPETLEEALPAIKKLQNINQELSAQLGESRVIISELKIQLKEANEANIAGSKIPTIKIGGTTYQVNHGAHGIGDAIALSKDEAACKKILAKKGQNALTKI